ncbi:hypothetical protein GCM10010873_13570 [Cypionkella aquatica]|uniref:Lipocalin-like domain-containing protein n=1 Tax=Cypionkella aquatica TaxID=1756042 RepID=A0AA37TS38_9RHOB|nr:lipocalin-like domain-containing protein [Cypionkella aquatica]GLS86383.1 hypothetical protein GCM10010873_13570 [Cypionkella aquatica]
MALADLIGTWRLLSHQFASLESDERRNMFGDDPQGLLMITADSRMMAMITTKDRKTAEGDAGAAALFKSMLAYAGPFRIEAENQLITTVEVAWYPDWVGGEQTREFSLFGDVLSLMTPVVLHPMFGGQKARGILKWQRV